MQYKRAYLYLFNKLTDIIKTLEQLDPDVERLDALPLLLSVQAQAEEICIKR